MKRFGCTSYLRKIHSSSCGFSVLGMVRPLSGSLVVIDCKRRVGNHPYIDGFLVNFDKILRGISPIATEDGRLLARQYPVGHATNEIRNAASVVVWWFRRRELVARRHREDTGVSVEWDEPKLPIAELEILLPAIPALHYRVRA